MLHTVHRYRFREQCSEHLQTSLLSITLLLNYNRIRTSEQVRKKHITFGMCVKLLKWNRMTLPWILCALSLLEMNVRFVLFFCNTKKPEKAWGAQQVPDLAKSAGVIALFSHKFFRTAAVFLGCVFTPATQNSSTKVPSRFVSGGTITTRSKTLVTVRGVGGQTITSTNFKV